MVPPFLGATLAISQQNRWGLPSGRRSGSRCGRILAGFGTWTAEHTQGTCENHGGPRVFPIKISMIWGDMPDIHLNLNKTQLTECSITWLQFVYLCRCLFILPDSSLYSWWSLVFEVFTWNWDLAASSCLDRHIQSQVPSMDHMGVPEMVVSKVVGLKWDIPWRWMIWGYPYFRKPPYRAKSRTEADDNHPFNSSLWDKKTARLGTAPWNPGFDMRKSATPKQDLMAFFESIWDPLSPSRSPEP